MRESLQSSVQSYLDSLFTNQDHNFFRSVEKGSSDPRLAKNKSKELGLEGISISLGEAQLLKFFVNSFHCEKFIEIGTLTGFSALYILQALPADGKLWTFEKNQIHADAAKEVLQSEIEKGKCEILVGDAQVELEKITSVAPFDGIFIDGNKSAYFKYLDWAEKNIKKNGLIIADNIFLSGAVWGEVQTKFSAKQIQVMRSFNERLSDPNLYSSCVVPTSEGFFVAQKLF